MRANEAKAMFDANPTAAHHLIASSIRTIYLMITKHPQNKSEGKFESSEGKFELQRVYLLHSWLMLV